MKIVIAGGSGLTGSAIIAKLIEDTRVTEIISIGRRELLVSQSKIKNIIVDFNNLNKQKSQIIGDVFICCLGTTIKNAGSREAFRNIDYDAIVNCAKLAKENNFKKFILISAAGSNSNSPIFYSRTKGETEEAIKSLGLNSLVLLRPSLILADRIENRPGEKFAINSMKILGNFLPKKILMKMATPLDDLVNAAIVKIFKSTSKLEVIEPSDF